MMFVHVYVLQHVCVYWDVCIRCAGSHCSDGARQGGGRAGACYPFSLSLDWVSLIHVALSPCHEQLTVESGRTCQKSMLHCQRCSLTVCLRTVKVMMFVKVSSLQKLLTDTCSWPVLDLCCGVTVFFCSMDVLDEADCGLVYQLVFVKPRAVAHAAGHFTCQYLFEPKRLEKLLEAEAKEGRKRRGGMLVTPVLQLLML